jgi:AcrR family transcriptional regulator
VTPPAASSATPASAAQASSKGDHPAEGGRRRPSSAPAEILKATQELILAGGVDGVSIRKVSQRCSYSAPTIYHHFGDKQGLIDALLEERFRPLLAAMEAIPRREDPVQHLREMAQAFVSFALENPAHYQLLMDPGPSDVESVPSATAARALVRGDLEELEREGTLATRDPDAAFQILWAVLHGVISLYLADSREEIAEGIEDLAFEMIEVGLLRRQRAGGTARGTTNTTDTKAARKPKTRADQKSPRKRR